MVNVAVAGGTGGVGRTIVDALNADSQHHTIVLARKVCIDLSSHPKQYLANFL